MVMDSTAAPRPEPGTRLRDLLAAAAPAPAAPVVVAELVPWAGALADPPARRV